jgi:hypothetical protein
MVDRAHPNLGRSDERFPLSSPGSFEERATLTSGVGPPRGRYDTTGDGRVDVVMPQAVPQAVPQAAPPAYTPPPPRGGPTFQGP